MACRFAQDKSRRVPLIGSNDHIERYAECLLKKQSLSKRDEICNYHTKEGIAGGIICDACPVYDTGEFELCKYAE